MSRRAAAVFATLLLSALLVSPGTARAKAGIAVLSGIVVPQGDDYATTIGGMYMVDLPVYSAFHVAPYTAVYKLEKKNSGTYVADLGLAFQFVVRTTPIKPFFGFTVGATPMLDELRLDVGFQAGIQWKIVANFSLVALGRYNIAIADHGSNLKRGQGMGGIQFDF
jgi:hypothetical protein